MPPNEQLSDPVQDVGGRDVCPPSFAYALSIHIRETLHLLHFVILGNFYQPSTEPRVATLLLSQETRGMYGWRLGPIDWEASGGWRCGWRCIARWKKEEWAGGWSAQLRDGRGAGFHIMTGLSRLSHQAQARIIGLHVSSALAQFP